MQYHLLKTADKILLIIGTVLIYLFFILNMGTECFRTYQIADRIAWAIKDTTIDVRPLGDFCNAIPENRKDVSPKCGLGGNPFNVVVMPMGLISLILFISGFLILYIFGSNASDPTVIDQYKEVIVDFADPNRKNGTWKRREEDGKVRYHFVSRDDTIHPLKKHLEEMKMHMDEFMDRADLKKARLAAKKGSGLGHRGSVDSAILVVEDGGTGMKDRLSVRYDDKYFENVQNEEGLNVFEESEDEKEGNRK